MGITNSQNECALTIFRERHYMICTTRHNGALEICRLHCLGYIFQRPSDAIAHLTYNTFKCFTGENFVLTIDVNADQPRHHISYPMGYVEDIAN